MKNRKKLFMIIGSCFLLGVIFFVCLLFFQKGIAKEKQAILNVIAKANQTNQYKMQIKGEFDQFLFLIDSDCILLTKENRIRSRINMSFEDSESADIEYIFNKNSQTFTQNVFVDNLLNSSNEVTTKNPDLSEIDPDYLLSFFGSFLSENDLKCQNSNCKYNMLPDDIYSLNMYLSLITFGELTEKLNSLSEMSLQINMNFDNNTINFVELHSNDKELSIFFQY